MTSNSWDAHFYQKQHAFVAAFGEDVVDLLAPCCGEVILDVGCGTGELAAKIAASGATVYGVDSAEQMIQKAIATYPQCIFLKHNGEVAFPFEIKFDAVFSNAALHWMLKAEEVVKNIATCLKSGGRFVFEMGGQGNIAKLLHAIALAVLDFGVNDATLYNYFPSISEYSSILESHGFVVRYAVLCDRPTQLEGPDGLKNWVKMFRNSILNQIEPSAQNAFLESIETYARDSLYRDGVWIADYVRLRMIAIKN